MVSFSFLLLGDLHLSESSLSRVTDRESPRLSSEDGSLCFSFFLFFPPEDDEEVVLSDRSSSGTVISA